MDPRGSALAEIEIVFERARDSAISFAWKRRIETFFPRTSTLILNENEPFALKVAVVPAGDETRERRRERHGRSASERDLTGVGGHDGKRDKEFDGGCGRRNNEHERAVPAPLAVRSQCT